METALENDKQVPWGYYFILPQIIKILHDLIFIASLAAVFINKDVKWYYPSIPLMLSILSRRMIKKVFHQMTAAFAHVYADKFAKSDFEELDYVYKSLVGGNSIIYCENFQRPRSSDEWFVFLVLQLLIVGRIATVFLFSVLAFFSWKWFLIIYFGIALTLYLFTLLKTKLDFRDAMERWVATICNKLDNNLLLKQRILQVNDFGDAGLRLWIKSQLILLLQSRIHPDHIDAYDIMAHNFRTDGQ
ncbi:MAG: hypothetical protein U0U70_00525 [Chitinophagaceae bacterium]